VPHLWRSSIAPKVGIERSETVLLKRFVLRLSLKHFLRDTGSDHSKEKTSSPPKRRTAPPSAAQQRDIPVFPPTLQNPGCSILRAFAKGGMYSTRTPTPAFSPLSLELVSVDTDSDHSRQKRHLDRSDRQPHRPPHSGEIPAFRPSVPGPKSRAVNLAQPQTSLHPPIPKIPSPRRWTMWESRRDFQSVWETWKAGFMASHAFHTLSFPPPALSNAGRKRAPLGSLRPFP
jgi:hypothetical protein